MPLEHRFRTVVHPEVGVPEARGVYSKHLAPPGQSGLVLDLALTLNLYHLFTLATTKS